MRRIVRPRRPRRRLRVQARPARPRCSALPLAADGAMISTELFARARSSRARGSPSSACTTARGSRAAVGRRPAVVVRAPSASCARLRAELRAAAAPRRPAPAPPTGGAAVAPSAARWRSPPPARPPGGAPARRRWPRGRACWRSPPCCGSPALGRRRRQPVLRRRGAQHGHVVARVPRRRVRAGRGASRSTSRRSTCGCRSPRPGCSASTTLALLLPEALGGIAGRRRAVRPAAHAVRRAARRSPAALALAVLPLAVITARSDTMDSVMAALAVTGAGARRPGGALAARVAAAWRARRAARARVRGQALRGAAARRRGGGAVVVRRPARAPVASGRARRRGGAFVVVALAWLVVVSVVPRTRGRGRSAPRRLGLARRAGLQRHGAAARGGRQRPERACGRNARGGWPRRFARSAGVAGRRRARPARARARGRRGAPPGAGGAAAAVVRPGPSGALDRDRGRRPRWRRSPSRWRSEGRAASGASAVAGCSRSGSGSSPASRCAASWPACARATWPASTRPSPPAWARAWRSPSAPVRGPRAWRVPRRCARSWPCRWPRRWPPSSHGVQVSGAPGRCRRRGSPPCRASCGRAPSASPTRWRSAHRRRPARSSPTTGARC